jgi:hypothetical protein
MHFPDTNSKPSILNLIRYDTYGQTESGIGPGTKKGRTCYAVPIGLVWVGWRNLPACIALEAD